MRAGTTANSGTAVYEFYKLSDANGNHNAEPSDVASFVNTYTENSKANEPEKKSDDGKPDDKNGGENGGNNSVDTGDDMNPFIWIALLALSLVAIIVVLITRRKKC